MKVTCLRCEYLENPLGIDTPRPRLSWQLESENQGAKQTAYQIVATSPSPLGSPKGALRAGARDEGTGWDTGKVSSDQSIHVEYAGPALKFGQRVEWKVRIWDEKGQPGEWSLSAWFEMGLLKPSDWKAAWIGSFLVGSARAAVPCPYLRKGFRLEKPVAAARLYITALGLYEACLNGKRIGDAELAPGWTDFRRRVCYQTYDVTGLLRKGENILGAILGDGWYCGHVEWRNRQLYGDRPKLLVRLVVTHPDVAQTVVVSDESWRHAFGPLVQADLLHGEHYDARLEFPGWDQPGFDDSKWFPVEIFPHPEGLRVVAQNGPAVKKHAELKAVSAGLKAVSVNEIKEWSGSRFIFDLGQNLTGRVRIRVRGAAGTTVRLRFAEVLNPAGSLYTANLRTARATDYYTCKGNGEETWEPKFTFHGFRYVELYGAIEKPERKSVTGIVLHSANPVTGSFECSDPLLNQLQHNILWGWKGNSVDVPTDCPQRDERLGWTGDAQVFSRTAAFNTQSALFWAKWLQSLEDSQGEAGNIPPTAPNTDAARTGDGGPAYADAAVIVPWNMYLAYGDRRIMAERYGMMKRFVDWITATSPDLVRANPAHTSWGGFGDWLALDGSGKVDGGTPKELIGTAFFAHSARLLSQMAAILDKNADAKKYSRLFETVRKVFQKRFVTPEGYITGRTQTSYVLALAFDLLPETLIPTAMDWLVRDIHEHKDHLSTGFAGTSYLPHVLTRYDRLDIAYRLLLQKSWPSWLYAVTQGATTIWERWDGWTHDKGFQDPGMNSFNHYAYGAIGDWLYRVVAGIDTEPAQPGYKHIIFHPQPGGGLTHARVTQDSLYGQIVSDWRIRNGNFEWDILVPPNTTATVILPGENQGREVESGAYHFSKVWKQ
jgi:alpha-L-rhamnosidase